MSLKNSLVVMITALISALSLSACEVDTAPRSPLSISEVSPQPATEGGALSVYGWGFGLEGEEDGVWLAGERLEVSFWSEGRVDVRLPEGRTGVLALVVSARGLVSAPVNLELLERAPLSVAQEGEMEVSEGEMGGVEP